MNEAVYRIDLPQNEPVKSFAPGTPERVTLTDSIAELRSGQVEIPLIIGGKEVRTGDLGECRIPHEHAHLLGTYHKAGPEQVAMAVDAAQAAREEWARMGWQHRLAVFRKAADLLAGPRRMLLNAATMLCQSKNVYQAEIDSACELIDFFRFNAHYARCIYEDQPGSTRGVWNQLEYRPLEGFVFAITPFNFTSIAGNLPTAPAMLGCTSVWKPASSAVYSAYYLMKLFQEAGLPDGVINFLPGSGGTVGDPVLASPSLGGVHFTGSTAVFQGIWRTIGGNIANYASYPRIVGETGGKDFVFAHASADPRSLVVALVRGAFEYQGQKCSAASRAYIPRSLWENIRDDLCDMIGELKMGGAEDFTCFVNAVIDRAAFETIRGYIEYARESAEAEILCGGQADDTTGYFIEPTLIVAREPDFKTMEEEIFGPVLTVYVYEDDRYEETLSLCDATSPYALTGAIFARDRQAIVKAREMLVNAAGNFYINDKPTGAVVGQQPFGGSRASGTNDKAGSALNLLRWLSPRTVKENFVPPTDYRYPFMQE